ncbi:MAG: hypothetical protein ACK5OX_13440 [Desertimonas sp.]
MTVTIDSRAVHVVGGARTSVLVAFTAVDTPMVVVDVCGLRAPVIDALTLALAIERPAIVISAAGTDDATTAYTRIIGPRERAVQDLLPDAVTLRTAPVAEDLEIYADAAGGAAYHAFGSASTPWVVADDVAAVADSASADIVAGDTRRCGHALVVTGAQPCGAEELLTAMGVTPIGLEATELRSSLVASGHPTAAVDVVLAHQEWAGLALDASPTVLRALDRPPSDPLTTLARGHR